ncbi:MAG TPA: hypothetical protein VJ937_08450 [Salinivirga sp.]|uniref:nSTAND1 domain-containing NTPase n=1 Tax=Salinivirga sp. TaxID=1970192 RepID=UPI002B499F2F|nr:hypothetical protein [Salinivirga sp.]HKK59493.1 hypothetical protein [Salinivirga sp.]
MSSNSNNNKMFNPFPGLRPFTTSESHLFFGREGQSEEVLSNLSQNRFVAVVGSSGSGKSSLMYCGVVPILYGGFITEAGSKWKIILSRPGNDPIGNLAKEIAAQSSEDNSDTGYNPKLIRAILESSSNGLVEAIKQTQSHDDQNYLILADQFEELFRFRKKFGNENAVNESFAYVRLIMNAIKQSHVPIYVVMTMRSDFIGECAQYQELTDMINTSHYLIPQMNRDNFRLAIKGPIAVGGGKISEKLVNELLNDLGDNPDQLPILQHALMRTWDFWIKHSGGKEELDVVHYDSIGRMEKALSNHANEAFNELSPEEKVICENMFKTLTERGNDNRGIRHPSSVEEIASIANSDEATVIKIIEHFRASGRSFLTSADKTLKSESIIDISHESLMRIWDKLKVWVDEEAMAIQMYMRLSEAAAMYQEGKIGLWRPPDLQLALNWRKEKQPTLTWAKRFSPAFERAMVYLETSEKAHLAEEENKIRLQKKALRRSRIFAIVLGSAAIISLGFMVYAITMQAESNKQRIIAEQQKEEAEKQRKEAETQKELALKNEQEAEEQREIALKSEKEAREQTKIAEMQRKIAEANLKEATRQKEIATKQTQEAQKQRQIADKKSKEALVEKNKAEQAQERTKELRMLSIARSMAVKSAQMEEKKNLKALLAYQAYQFNREYGGEQFNPDIYDGLYYAIKAKNSPEYNTFRGHKDAVRALKFKPQNQHNLYSAGSDGSILQWNIEDSLKGTETMYTNGEIIRDVAFSPNGQFMAIADDNFEVKLINLSNQEDSLLYRHKNIITALTFADNQTLISSSTDSTIIINDIYSGEQKKVRENAQIWDLKVANQMKRMLYLTNQPAAVLMDLTNHQKDIFYTGPNTFYAGAISKNDSLLALGGKSGSIAIFTMHNSELIKELNAHNARINDIAFSQNDKYLASVAFDGTARIYQTQNFDKTPLVIRDYSSWGMALTFNDKSNELFTSYVDSNIKRWDLDCKIMANKLLPHIQRKMTKKEWETYVGKDIPYINTIEHYKQ